MQKNLKFPESECSFNSEDELVKEIQRQLPEFLRKRAKALTIGREIGVGRAIADLVVLLRPPGGWLLPGASLTIHESVVLAALRRRGSTRIDILERICRLPHGALREGPLERLESWGIIESGAGGRLAISPAWRRHTKLLAIEAKLTRWRDALKQAHVYRRYADESYVAIPREHSAIALKNKGLFQEAGVGLILVSSSKLKLAIPPARKTTDDWRVEFVYSRLALSDSFDL